MSSGYDPMQMLGTVMRIREMRSRQEAEAKDEVYRQQQQQEQKYGQFSELLKLKAPIKEIETAAASEGLGPQFIARLRIQAAVQKENDRKAQETTGFQHLGGTTAQGLAAAFQALQDDPTNPELQSSFGNLFPAISQSFGELSTPVITAGLAGASQIRAEREMKERERALSSRKTLAEMLEQDRALRTQDLSLREKFQAREAALSSAEEKRRAESLLGLDEGLQDRRLSLTESAEDRATFRDRLTKGRQLEIDEEVNRLSELAAQPAQVPMRPFDIDAALSESSVLSTVPYAKTRIVARARLVQAQNAPMIEVYDDLRSRGIEPSVVPGRVMRGLQAGETSTGRYIAPSAFYDPRTGLPMPGKDGSKDKKDVEENASAQAFLDNVEAAVEELRAAKGDAGRYERVKTFSLNYFQTGEGEASAAFLNALRSLGVTVVSRGIGQESGAPSNADIARAMQTVPNVLEALAKDPKLAKARILAARQAGLSSGETKYKQVYSPRVYRRLLQRAQQDGVAEARARIRQELGGATGGTGGQLLDDAGRLITEHVIDIDLK